MVKRGWNFLFYLLSLKTLRSDMPLCTCCLPPLPLASALRAPYTHFRAGGGAGRGAGGGIALLRTAEGLGIIDLGIARLADRTGCQ